MMKRDIILIGSGGCMRELVWQLQELNAKEDAWNILGYVDGKKPENAAGIRVGAQNIRYLGDDELLLQRQEVTEVAVCVGAPAVRKRIAQKLQRNPRLHFPNLILGNTHICPDVRMGKGCIISMDARISTNVTLGDFVFLNLGSGICHDGRIGDYVTLSPDVRLAGDVTVEQGCDIGLGAKVIQGVRIGRNTVVGAGSVIIGDIDGDCTVAGVPAGKLKGDKKSE